MTSSANPALSQWSLDREIVMSRVIDAPRELVFEAWSDPKHLPQWFGPKGFKIETLEIDVRVGGVWRFNMIGPDGTVYPNRMRFRRIERPSLMEMDHGADQDDDPGLFRFTVTFAEQSNGKTVLMMRQLASTTAQRDGMIGFGAVEYGYETLDKLAAYVSGMKR
ncbi:SRPBCC family protein [Bradyrhizobium hipponense]|nr:SRPBCC family protein [Bradyrhizobium hipponense]